MVTLSDNPSEVENKGLTVKRVGLLATGFVGLSMTVVACCGGIIYGVSEMSRQIGQSIAVGIGEGFEKMLEASAEAALKDTEQITDIVIPDLFVPVFGTDYLVELNPEIKKLDGSDAAFFPEVSDGALYVVKGKKPQREKNHDDEILKDGMLCLAQFSEDKMSQEHLESWTQIKKKLESGEIDEKEEEAIESIRIHRIIRGKSATFLLRRKVDNNFGGKEAWALLGIFQGKESQAVIFMMVTTEQMEKDQILAMIDSIR